MNMMKVFFVLPILALSFVFPQLSEAQQTLTLTTTSTSNSASDSPVLGCPACTALRDSPTGFTDPHPDTSLPIFKGAVDETLLPAAIANGLPPDNQFGVGVPTGSSSFPLSISTPFSQGTFLNMTTTFSSNPGAAGSNNNVITQNIGQVTPGATFIGPTATDFIDQDFSILFSVSSLTDADGVLVGVANGNFTQTVDGVVTSGVVQFDSTNGFTGTNLHDTFTTDGVVFSGP